MVQRLADQVDIIRNPRKDLAVGRGIVVLERQTADFLIDFLAQIVGDLHGNGGHHEALYVGKYHGDQVQANNEHNQPAYIVKIHIQPGPKIVGDQSFGELGGHIAQQLGADNGKHGR